LDFVCLTLVLLALIIFLSGGFRVRVFDVRIALTSPVRLLVWALGLAILRHVLAPQRPIYADAPARVRAAWGTDEVRTAVAALVGTRFALFLIGYLAIPLVGYPLPPPPPPPPAAMAAGRQRVRQSPGALGCRLVSRHRDGRLQL